jgi:hypothetical protein
MAATKLEKAKGEEVIVHVPPGTARNVKIVEADPAGRGQDITIQVSKERKALVSGAIGVIVK